MSYCAQELNRTGQAQRVAQSFQLRPEFTVSREPQLCIQAFALQDLPCLEQKTVAFYLNQAGRQSVLEDWDIAGVATQLVREFETARKIASPELEYA